MQHDILYQPTYSLLMVQLSPGEEVIAEAGAMVAMSPDIEIETKMRGGILSGLKRSVLGGESFFINTFKAPKGGSISFAPSLSGDIVHLNLTGQTVYAQSGGFIASAPTVQVDTKWGGAKSFFAGEGLFLLRISGSGDTWLSSYGAIHEETLGAGERWIVDTGHIVAFDEAVQYSVRRVGGLKSTLFSGEGLVVEFTGPGRVWIQTRNPGAFISWLAPQLPKTGGS
jgi:uncharacterized protein (TIGR00266 family)